MEEEELIICVNFPDFDNCQLFNEETILQITDLVSDIPKCTIDNNKYFVGKHQISLGTQLFFTADEGNNKNNFVSYTSKSINVVNFKLKSLEK
jgi:hypothetical protein